MVASSGVAAEESPRLVLDLNGGPEDSLFYRISPPNNPLLYRSLLVGLDDQVIFSADDGVHGAELWKSDGTAAGTVLLRDIWQGPDQGLYHAAHSAFAAVGGQVFFAADDGEHGLELWRTDGTTEGTRMVKDIEPGGASSNPNDFVTDGEILYFLTHETYPGSPQRELWRSDGSSEGTVRIMAGDPSRVTIIGGTLLFMAHDSDHGREPWRSDGTAAGSRLLRDIRPGPFSSVGFGGFGQVGDMILFAADDGVHGAELWRTDGTTAGTELFEDLVPGGDSSSPSCCHRTNGRSLFAARTAGFDWELWITDGTAEGTAPLQPTNPVTLQQYLLGRLTVAGDRLFFPATTPEAGNELWVTDGTAAGTRMVADLRPGASSSAPTEMTAFDGELYFSAIDASAGRELWRSDGSAEGTEMVQDLRPGSADSTPRFLTEVGGRLFFGARDDDHGHELWTLGPACPEAGAILCLGGGRFRVEIEWRDFEGETGVGKVVPFQTDDSGLFWFFSDSNWEVMVKVLDGCGINDHYWVFAAGTTDVEYTMKVTDTASGLQREYSNPLGSAAEAVTDDTAFPSCP